MNHAALLYDDPLLDDDDEDDIEREIDEHWARVAATPWHKRDWRSVEQLLTPPVSRPGRVVFYGLLPFVIVAAIASNLALFALR